MEELVGTLLKGSVDGDIHGDVQLVAGKRGKAFYKNGMDQWVDLGNQRSNCMGNLEKWASLTGLTAVSKIKPRLAAQWAVDTRRKGPSRMEKVTSRMNWSIRNTSQIRN